MKITELFTWPGQTAKQTITVELIKEPARLHMIEISTPVTEDPSLLQIEAREVWKLIGMLQALQRRSEGK